MRCKERLEASLREQGVPFQTQHHPIAFTAQEVAASEHVPGRMVVKVVMVVADGKPVMLALRATDRVDLSRVRSLLGVSEARLAEEREFSALFPDTVTPRLTRSGLAVILVATRVVTTTD